METLLYIIIGFILCNAYIIYDSKKHGESYTYNEVVFTNLIAIVLWPVLTIIIVMDEWGTKTFIKGEKKHDGEER